MTRFLQTVMRRLTPVLATLCRLGEHRGGNVAIIFGLAAIPVIVGAGIAMDTTRAYMVKLRLGAALDAAALAVGSQSNQGATALNTILNNYFYNNYCKSVPSGASVTSCTSTVATETGISVQPTSDITAATVNFSAQATVPTIFMRLVGINNLNVSVTAQTTKFPGMEIALVLDNTGSMLCGGTATAASGYSGCNNGTITSDTSCANSSNQSRICTLIPAAQQFVATIQNAITAPQSIYISIVPYVTNVNVGNAFCTSATNCTNIAKDTTCPSPGVNFIDRLGNVPPQTPLTGNITSGSSTISNISPNTNNLGSGMPVTGSGIPSDVTISSVRSSSQITISSSATLTITGNRLTFGVGSSGPGSASTPTPIATTTSTAATVTGSWTNGSKTINNVSNTSNIQVGMPISSSSSGIPGGAYVAAVNSSSVITISANATATQTAKTLKLTSLGATATSGNNIITNITLSSTAPLPTVGQIITGNGIPANAAITSVDTALTNFQNGTGQVHICANATTGPVGASTVTNTLAAFYTPIAYDSAYNNASPIPGSSATKGWAGCVVEPTSYDEMTGATSASTVSSTGALVSNVSDPDTSEPTSGWPSWYMHWWPSGLVGNSWTTPALQDKTTEIIGSLGSYDKLDGPNQGCPAPILPLTDLTTSAGQTAINTAISDMWPKDANGTQVHVGMVWGWRALSPYGPFTKTNGHPLDYATANTTGWKKIVVLMTDGSEEWPTANEYTGLGVINDGKIGTTNTGTAQDNLDTRLQTVCSNMAEQGIMIFTIGLGTDGANNSILKNNCPANGGIFSPATPATLNAVFQQFAKLIIHLRITK